MDVDVTNVVEVSALDLGVWLVQNILNDKVPHYGANSSINSSADLLPLLPTVTNKIVFCTELYVICMSAKPVLSSTKGDADARLKAEGLSQKRDVLYRSIQTLESVRETLSKMINGLNSNSGRSHFNSGI